VRELGSSEPGIQDMGPAPGLRATKGGSRVKLLNRTSTCLLLATILCLLMAAPATAGTLLYDNGPVNGTINSFTIEGGYWTSDSFTLSSASTLTEVQIGLWVYPTFTAGSVGWLIGTTPDDSSLGSGTGVLTDAFQFINADGYNIYESTFPLSVPLAAGTYYLTIQNAGPSEHVWWDVSNGPSTGYSNSYSPENLSGRCTLLPGATCSESFEIYGNVATPEPSSLVLLGSGMLIFAAFMRKFTN